GDHRFRCHGTHGWVDMVQAIARSCDTFFYTRGFELGLDPISKYGRLFGLGEPTGLGLGSDRAGLMPSRGWYDKEGRTYSPGMAVNAAIGQGDVLVTPLQLAVVYSAIANGGTVLTPQLVERVEDVEGHAREAFSPKTKRTVPLSPGTLEVVRSGLVAV